LTLLNSSFSMQLCMFLLSPKSSRMAATLFPSFWEPYRSATCTLPHSFLFTYSFFVLFLVALRFELRALHLLGRHAWVTPWTPLPLFLYGSFSSWRKDYLLPSTPAPLTVPHDHLSTRRLGALASSCVHLYCPFLPPFTYA
jgi:hypothetical protein